MPNNPLSVAGYEIDPESLLPADELAKEKEVLAKRRIRKKIEEGQALISELSGDKGILVQKVVALYIERINKLIGEDTECQAYEKLLSTVQHSVNFGKVIENKFKHLTNV
jgi:hypothetical protein